MRTGFSLVINSFLNVLVSIPYINFIKTLGWPFKDIFPYGIIDLFCFWGLDSSKYGFPVLI